MNRSPVPGLLLCVLVIGYGNVFPDGRKNRMLRTCSLMYCRGQEMHQVTWDICLPVSSDLAIQGMSKSFPADRIYFPSIHDNYL